MWKEREKGGCEVAQPWVGLVPSRSSPALSSLFPFPLSPWLRFDFHHFITWNDNIWRCLWCEIFFFSFPTSTSFLMTCSYNFLGMCPFCHLQNLTSFPFLFRFFPRTTWTMTYDLHSSHHILFFVSVNVPLTVSIHTRELLRVVFSFSRFAFFFTHAACLIHFVTKRRLQIIAYEYVHIRP